MTFFQQIGIGISSYFKAIGMIFRGGMIIYFIIPIIATFLLFMGGHAFLGGIKEWMREWVFSFIPIKGADFFGADFLKGAISFLIGGVVEFAFFYAFALWGGSIIMILLSPIFPMISEKTEYILTGKEYPFSFTQLLKDILRGIWLSIRNILIQTLLIVLMFILSFIPVIGWFIPLIVFIINAYYIGFSFMDIVSERKLLNLKQRMRVVGAHKWLAITVGSIFTFSLMIPYFGFMIAIYMSLIASIATTIAMLDKNFDWSRKDLPHQRNNQINRI